MEESGEKEVSKEEIAKTLKSIKNAMYKRKLYFPKRFQGNISMNTKEKEKNDDSDLF